MSTCIFVHFRSFSREISTQKLGITIGQRLLALELLNKIAYACSEEQYHTLHEQFTTSVATTILEYYQANWHNIREEWVLGLKLSSGSFMNNTNNRLERLNGQLKVVIQRNSSLEEFLDKFYVVMNSLRIEHCHKVVYQFQKSQASKHVPDLPENLYENTLTRYASGLVLHQLGLMSKVKGFEAIPGIEGVHAIASHEGQLNVTITSCPCTFRRAMALPCRHILALRNKLESALLEVALCDKRWLLDTYKRSQTLFQASDSNSSTLNQLSTEARKPLTQNEKY